MYKMLTPFRIGLIVIAIGGIWTGIVFDSSIKTSNNFHIDKMNSVSMSLALHGRGIGFYEISSNQYSNSILVKVLDEHGTYVGMKTITNKETVNYFTFDHTGQYTLELTNLSSNPVQLSVEFGDTKSQGFGVSSSIILVGACLLMLAGYFRLKNYISAHPE
ncbi:MAG: hypothetical protein KGI25_03880 [Thaumarchaeota archaeon]|nr:hypothetical protein [Nitrososphaerota archaeon]